MLRSVPDIPHLRTLLWKRCRAIGGGLAWLAAGVLPLPTQSAGPPPDPSVTFAYTPLAVGHTVYGLPLVRVRVNGVLTGTFLFDTGTNVCLVTDTLAAKLGLPSHPVRQDGRPFRVEGRPARSVMADSLQVGAMRLENVQLVLVKRRRLVALAQRPLDGILGTNVLQSFPVLFDFPQHRITVWRAGALTPDELARTGFSEADAVPLSDPRSQFLYTAPVLWTNGAAQRREDLLVDTGAERTTLSHDAAVSLHLKPTGRPAPANFLAGSYPALAARVASLKVGGVSVSNLLVGYPVQPAPQRRLLGADALMHFRVLLDFPERKMYIQQDGMVPAPSPASERKP